MLTRATLKQKKCKECGTKFQPRGSFDKVCESLDCKLAFGLKVAAKSKAKREAEAKRKAAEQRKADKEKLARLKPGYLESKAQDAINEYVRIRDYFHGCISCDKPAHWHGQWHAGHLKTRGANSFLRFHLWNLNKQCSVCNNHQSGNVAEHERGIVARYGAERLEFLNTAPRLRRYSDEYLIRLARIFRKKTIILKKRKGLN